MKSFEWANAAGVDDAVKLLAVDGTVDPDEMPRPIGGGQDLLTTMKAYITRPSRVVNLKTIPHLNETVARDPATGGLRLGALVTIAQLAEHPAVLKDYPGLAEAAHAIATPQIRHMGTVGGNFGQRPRCWYFRLEDVQCLKRGGTTCYAKDGENKYHAIFATDGPCVIVHPSDLAPMLAALNATVSITGPAGKRDVSVEKFFHLPADGSVRTENVLGDGDVITDVSVPPAAGRSTYLKFKERESLDFAMASVAAVVAPGKVSLVLGGVAPVPWRCGKAEAFLAGKTLDEPTIAEAAKLATDGAKPLAKNGYKVPLVQALVRRALTKLATA